MLGLSRNNAVTVAMVLVGTHSTQHSFTPSDHLQQ
jgi:hypothetical protein